MFERIYDLVTRKPNAETKRLNRRMVKELRRDLEEVRSVLFQEPFVVEYSEEFNTTDWHSQLPILYDRFPELNGLNLRKISINKDPLMKTYLNKNYLWIHMLFGSWPLAFLDLRYDEFGVEINVSLTSKNIVDNGGDASREVNRLLLAKEVLRFFQNA